MIQRIQTVYMLASIMVLLALYNWFPVIKDEAGLPLIEKNEPLIIGLIIAAVALTIFSILKYKTRQTQFVLNRLAIILNFILLGVFVFRALKVSGETLVSEKGIGVLVPIISIVFLALANRAIRRDENLVKSADRLR
ncbi:MAG: DUF4293 family protein [Gilvibacter sp.]